MPNRTIYLPDEVDEIARRLDINLSKLTQDALRKLAQERDDENQQRLQRFRKLVKEANITYPPNYLRDMRREAGDDLR